jgi:drug/metabolite transporter (DMT)-like permease
MRFIIIWLIVITIIGVIVIVSPKIYGNSIKMGITCGVLSGMYIITYICVKYYKIIKPINEQLIIIQSPIMDNIPIASEIFVINENNHKDII